MTAKLGPHVIKPTPEALDVARAAYVVKALDDTTALKVATKATVRVYRRYFAQQDVNRSGAEVVDEVVRALGNAPATHVELFNETAQRLGQGLERYVDFTREAVARLHEIRPDSTLVAFCFSTGNPEREDWLYLKEHAYGGASVIGLHEYWGRQGFSGWNALRYRSVHAWLDGDHPPFLISECGRDRVEGGKGGWRADGLSEAAYLAELRAYDAEIAKDAYVIAATPFTAGATRDWEAFSTDSFSGQLAHGIEPLPAVPAYRPKETNVAGLTKGIDISNNNGAIDFEALRDSDRRFAFVKASEDDGFTDPFLSQNLDGLKRLGWARGVYHFARPSVSSPAASVTLFQQALEGVGGLQPGDLIALDIEDERVPEGQSLHQWVAEWLDLAERVFGVKPFKYSGRWYTSTRDLEHDDLARWPTWWASYTPAVPDPVPGWGPITVWQYQANGAEPGIAGDVDENLFYGKFEELVALGLTKSAPVPVPGPATPDARAALAKVKAAVAELEAALA